MRIYRTFVPASPEQREIDEVRPPLTRSLISLDPFEKTAYTSRMIDSDDDYAAPVLPSVLRLLCVGAEEPSWALLTMQLGSQGCHEPQFRWSSTANEALTILRREIFDSVIIVTDGLETGNDFGWSTIFALVDAVRAGGHDEPVLLVTPRVSDEQIAQLSRIDCEILCSKQSWNSQALVPLTLRMVYRSHTLQATLKLKHSQRRQLSREKNEAERFLSEQQRMIQDVRLMGHRTRGAESVPAISDELCRYYETLLRTHGMMGEGSLSVEVSQLAKILCQSGIDPGTVLEMHLRQTENLISRAGNRSSRHLVSRADLLAIELLLYMGQFYCLQHRESGSPQPTA